LYLQTIDKNFVRDLLGNALTDNYDFNIHITSLTRDQESLPSKMVNKVDGPYGSTELPNTYESLSSNFLYFKATHGVVLPPVPSDGCDCNYFNKIFKDNTIVQINTWLTNYNDNINVNTHTRIDLDTYNDYNVNLEKLKKSMDPTCCFYGLLSIYEDIWKTLWASYNQKYDYYDLVTNSSRWKEDSNILNNSVLLKDYIKKLESTVAPLISITVTQKNLCVKPRYSRYFELYGIPENLEFDPEKMMQIDLELSLENNDECLEAVSTDCSAYNSETDCCD
jgi:hypothetical protein